MKCSCSACGKHIEYEAAAAGTEIACPHCGAATRLAAFSAAAPPPIQQTAVVQPATSRATPWLIIIIVAAVAVPVVVAVIGLLAAIAIPNFIKAKQTAQKNVCVAHLRQIDGAKAIWALEHKKSNGDEP